MYEKLLKHRYKLVYALILCVILPISYAFYKRESDKRDDWDRQNKINVERSQRQKKEEEQREKTNYTRESLNKYRKERDSMPENMRSIYDEVITKLEVELDHPDASSAEIESLTNQRLLLNKK